jgi:hypothetical protein
MKDESNRDAWLDRGRVWGGGRERERETDRDRETERRTEGRKAEEKRKLRSGFVI